MNKISFVATLIFAVNNCVAQNLVPNPSFENYINCPSGLGQLYQCHDWLTFGRSPDYFNVCATDTNAGVPNNYYGTENPSSGNGYCGLVTLSAPMRTEEYIGAQLIQPLTAGLTYYASLKISRCDHSVCSNDKLGICFSTVPFDSLNPPPMNNIAMVYALSIVTTTTGWYELKGSFVADSNYNYVMVGNFFNNTASLCLPLTYEIHYYIDDVCVSTDSLSCYTSVGINDADENKIVLITPDPFIDKINIIVRNDGNFEFTLTDITGKTVISHSFANSTSLNSEFLPPGVYFYELKSSNTIIKSGKILK